MANHFRRSRTTQCRLLLGQSGFASEVTVYSNIRVKIGKNSYPNKIHSNAIEEAVKHCENAEQLRTEAIDLRTTKKRDNLTKVTIHLHLRAGHHSRV
ncbi:hypothetical protein FPOAC1_010195 [Fusarium poae]|uniref:hypothetical protein n=1 Tax=Fusarium poae TaxID=36050 RepID=UPI001CE762BB|nr:hypothetical protein FPOAC1_010195 [Fusarium poae]KAG8665400.1 hypothetical protein FPOAC1_010195 [Fusarium poae]